MSKYKQILYRSSKKYKMDNKLNSNMFKIKQKWHQQQITRIELNKNKSKNHFDCINYYTLNYVSIIILKTIKNIYPLTMIFSLSSGHLLDGWDFSIFSFLSDRHALLHFLTSEYFIHFDVNILSLFAFALLQLHILSQFWLNSSTFCSKNQDCSSFPTPSYCSFSQGCFFSTYFYFCLCIHNKLFSYWHHHQAMSSKYLFYDFYYLIYF